MTHKEAEQYVARYDKKLKASDKRFDRCVRLVLDDGSIFDWDSAFAVEIDDGNFLAVFTEHHGFYVHHHSDVLDVRQYTRIYKKIESI